MANTSVPTSTRTQSILFVCYGSGHVRMVLPVARAMQARSGVTVQILGLSTAAVDVREAGLPLLQFKDFVEDGADGADAPALAHGRRLMADLSGVPRDVDETIAYLGLSYADLVAEHGEAEAARRYAERGRQAFLPVASLRRILQRVQPDLLVVTNSPRGERAAVIAALGLGIPSVCMVDLFAIDEVQWIGQPGYAQRVCVLNPAVKAFLQTAGRNPAEIVVTGNPAFDALNDSAVVSAGLALRRERGWGMKKVLLWPTQVEPAVHPFSDAFTADLTGDPSLPQRALHALVDWVLSRDDCVLCVRPRAGEALPDIPALASALAARDPRVVITGQDWPLPTLLHATDVVVTLTSTVGLEGHLTGARVVQVLGSVFAHAMPMQAYGLCDASVSVADLPAALAQCVKLPRRKLAAQGGGATAQVVAVLGSMMSAARAASSARANP